MATCQDLDQCRSMADDLRVRTLGLVHLMREAKAPPAAIEAAGRALRAALDLQDDFADVADAMPAHPHPIKDGPMTDCLDPNAKFIEAFRRAADALWDHDHAQASPDSVTRRVAVGMARLAFALASLAGRRGHLAEMLGYVKHQIDESSRRVPELVGQGDQLRTALRSSARLVRGAAGDCSGPEVERAPTVLAVNLARLFGAYLEALADSCVDGGRPVVDHFGRSLLDEARSVARNLDPHLFAMMDLAQEMRRIRKLSADRGPAAHRSPAWCQPATDGLPAAAVGG